MIMTKGKAKLVGSHAEDGDEHLTHELINFKGNNRNLDQQSGAQ